jgi:hypothetical protein
MPAPLITCLISSPLGDVPVDADKIHLPLECDPSKTPYKVYFQTIKNLLEHDSFSHLLKAAGKRCGKGVKVNEINEIIIRAEKHGALYHPASVELIFEKSRLKFGLNVAVSETGRDWLKKEFSVIQDIKKKCSLPYLPEVYFFEEQATVSFLLEEWFEGYHEFHLSMTESGEQVLKLWEFGKGYRYLSAEQRFEIYRQASKILTLYYDMNDFSQIYPWHHAAGDFIAKAEGNGVDIRLITARQYDPYMVFQEKEQMNPVIALFYFLLNLTVRMRLDKLDGVGDAVWAEDFCLEASVKGFLEGLGLKAELKDYFGSEKEFVNILKSFSQEDLRAAYSPLIDMYKGTTDYPVIIENLDRHVEALNAILRNCPS